MKKLFFLLAILLSLSIVSVEANARDVITSQTYQTEISTSFNQPDSFLNYNFCQRTDAMMKVKVSEVVQYVLTDELIYPLNYNHFIFNYTNFNSINIVSDNLSHLSLQYIDSYVLQTCVKNDKDNNTQNIQFFI